MIKNISHVLHPILAALDRSVNFVFHVVGPRALDKKINLTGDDLAFLAIEAQDVELYLLSSGFEEVKRPEQTTQFFSFEEKIFLYRPLLGMNIPPVTVSLVKKEVLEDILGVQETWRKVGLVLPDYKWNIPEFYMALKQYQAGYMAREIKVVKQVTRRKHIEQILAKDTKPKAKAGSTIVKRVTKRTTK